MFRTLLLAGTVLLVASRAGAAEPKTPNDIFARGLPTFVVGTAGDADSDRKVRAQAEAIRGMLFPEARVVDDSEIDLAAGPAGWPANPVLYGGPHVNSVAAALAERLPFEMAAGRLDVAGEKFEGDEFRPIALVPGRGADGDLPACPPFVLYAGCGTPGIAEINGVSHGGEGFLVADRFGRLLSGDFVPDGEGGLAARVAFRARRLPWKTDRQVARLAVLPAPPDAEAVDAACRRGIAAAAKALRLEAPPEVVVHVYPDRGSKRSLTGDAGDGRADVSSRSLHVLPFDAAEGGPLEALVAHEVTHVFSYEVWGPAGTPLMAEGLAVWAAGQYGGQSLDRWAAAGREAPALEAMLGGFRRRPEQETYPAAGLFVGALIEKLGMEKVRDHIYGATPERWVESCRAAGTTAAAVEALYRACTRG